MLFAQRLGLRQNLGRTLRLYSNTIAPHEQAKHVNLTWDQFFKLRQRRRFISRGCSVVTTLAGLAAGWAVISNMEIDPTQTVFEIEVVYLYGLGVVASGFLGYLAGPAFGNLIFRGTLGKNLSAFIEKDVDFLRRIDRNRPDARRANATNLLKDYYGERIFSRSGYRQWLREANLFTRKSQRFL